MSTNDDELISADLEALLGGDEMKPAKPTKKAPAKKTAAKAPEPESEVEEKSPESLAEIEARIRAQVEAEVREKILAEQEAPVVVDDSDLVTEGAEIMPPAVKKVPEGHVLIHIVEDGFTYGEKVLYRGQELTVDPEDQPWVRYDGKTQIRIWGRRYFREGHWDGSGFDLNDPALTEAEKNRLKALASQAV